MGSEDDKKANAQFHWLCSLLAWVLLHTPSQEDHFSLPPASWGLRELPKGYLEVQDGGHELAHMFLLFAFLKANTHTHVYTQLFIPAYVTIKTLETQYPGAGIA